MKAITVVSLSIMILSVGFVSGQSSPKDSLTKSIETYFINAEIAERNTDLTSALDYSASAFSLISKPYDSKLKLQVIEQYISILAKSPDQNLFTQLCTDVLFDLNKYSCDSSLNSDLLTVAQSINHAATQRQDRYLSDRSFDFIVNRINKCKLDSSLIASTAIRCARMHLELDNASDAYKYLNIAQNSRASLSTHFNGDLMFLEAQIFHKRKAFESSLERALSASETFQRLEAYNKALEPLEFAFHNLTPFLDSTNISRIVAMELGIISKLEKFNNTTQKRITSNYLTINILKKKHALISKRELNQVVITAIASSLLTATLLFWLFRSIPKIYSGSSSTLNKTKKTASSHSTNEEIFQDCKSFGYELVKNKYGEIKEISPEKLNELFFQKFPEIYDKLLVKQADWTSGERLIFITLLIGLSPMFGAQVLNTTTNSYRVRKSKLLKKIPEKYRDNPPNLILSL